MDRFKLIKELAIICANRMEEERVESVEYPAMMACVMKLFHESWCKATGIPLGVGAAMLEGMFFDIIESEKKKIDTNLN